MGKKLVVVLLILAVGVGLVLMVPKLTGDGANDLLIRALSLEKLASEAYQANDYESARQRYSDALNIVDQLEVEFPDSREVDSEEYRKLTTRVVDLHPMTIIQNARTSGGGVVTNVPTQAVTVGPVETWQAEKVSIWQAGSHDNPFGQRLTALMISKKIPDASVPMSLLADHPNVQFNYLRGGIGVCSVEMH